MIINSIRVKNFRSIYDETLYLNDLTALLGPNGAGKSSFLKAIEFFYRPNANYTLEDFYNKTTESAGKNNNIEITITYSELTEYEENYFQKYVKDNKLIIKKVLEWPKKKGSQHYYGEHLQNPDFDNFRNASGAAALRNEYNELKNGEYTDLPDYTNKDNAEISLKELEESNPADCTLRQDEGQFFGFYEVGNSKLEDFTRFIYIPAVHDASEEALDNKKSVFTQIMDLVVRGTLAQKKEFSELKTDFQDKYDKFIEVEDVSLENLTKDINQTLGIYVPNATVEIDWQHQNIKLPIPTADIELIEDGYGSSVERCGHGLQRAYIMSMFQYLAKITSQKKTKEVEHEEIEKTSPTIVIGIEEPEIYQHPNMQRYLSRILKRLAEGSVKGVAEKFQVVYTTHSPLFVDLENFENIRRLKKVQIEENLPNVTKIDSTNFVEVVDLIAQAENREDSNLSPEGFEARIKAIMTPWMNEGFFSDMVVLVEGITDRAAIIGYSNAIKEEFKEDMEVNGISVIPCMGKNNLHQPYTIFNKLNIPVYCIWDSDFKKYENKDLDKQQNEINKHHRLLRLCGHNTEDWPDNVAENYACFHNNLEDTLRNEIGESFDQIIQDCVNYYEMPKRDAIKRPKVVERLVKESKINENSSETLENIIKAIYDMRKSISVTHSQKISDISDNLDIDVDSEQDLSNVNENASLDRWL